MVKFFNTYGKVNPSHIEEIESFVGLSFPDEYRAHLLKYNGGECEPNVFTFMENGKKTNSDLNWFLAIHDGEDENLKSFIESYKLDEKRLPSQMLPIGFDSFGNLICISCDGYDRGKVYFWDHENEVDYARSDDTDYRNLYLISNSFVEFINGLHDISEILGDD